MTPEVTQIGAQIERLTKQASGNVLELKGKTFSAVTLHRVEEPEHVPEGIELHTLSSLCDYIIGRIDAGYLDSRRPFVHVYSPTSVHLCTGIFGEFNQRAELARAVSDAPKINYGSFMDVESFIISLMSLFTDSPARAAVQLTVGNLTNEATRIDTDDGVSQVATVRKGLVQMARTTVVNPHVLAPYRTFSEIVQPESPFILRLRGGSTEAPPTVALFECDQGRWKLEATQRIKAFLDSRLSAHNVPVYA